MANEIASKYVQNVKNAIGDKTIDQDLDEIDLSDEEVTLNKSIFSLFILF